VNIHIRSHTLGKHIRAILLVMKDPRTSSALVALSVYKINYKLYSLQP
jgi:hypothetical protein